VPEDMTFADWARFGIERDWISREFCMTHDVWPSTPEEGALIDEGEDPCAFAVRFKEPGQTLIGGRENW